MKHSKFVLCIMLIMSIIVIKASAYSIQAVNSDGVTIYYEWTWTTDNKKALSVTSGDYSGSIVIPESVTYDGTTYPVIRIGQQAFFRCTDMTDVTIPNSVTEIAYAAFQGCSKLSNVTIPNSVTSIGGQAFYQCTGLKSIIIPTSVINIGNYAFSYTGDANVYVPVADYSAFCNNQTVGAIVSGGLYPIHLIDDAGNEIYKYTIPDGVDSIGDYAFAFCQNLLSVAIPNSVTSIGNRSFWYCEQLVSLTLPGSVETIGEYAFSVCTNLAVVNIPNNIKTISEGLFSGCNSLSSIAIPNGVTGIGAYAFSGCI